MRQLFLLLGMFFLLATTLKAQDSIRTFEKGRRFAQSKDLAIASADDKTQEARLAKLLSEAQSAGSLEAAKDKLAAATNICRVAAIADCRQKISTVRRMIYREAFQRKLRHLRSADWAYSRQRKELEALQMLLEEGDLGTAQENQYEQIERTIHESEVHRLMSVRTDFAAYMTLLEEASEIDVTHLSGSLGREIASARREAVDVAIEEVLSTRTRSFHRQLKQVELAKEYLDYLPEQQRERRANQLGQYRRELIREELEARRSTLANTRDWREILAGYEGLLQFAQRYAEDLGRRTIRHLRQDRQAFLMDEYDIRIQRSLQHLQLDDLDGAQLALAGAVELSLTNLLPDGPAAYRHRELYQTLYEAQHQRLQAYKSKGDWMAAESVIQRLESLFADAPFILARATIREERQLLELARWDFLLAEAEQNMWRSDRDIQFKYTHQLLDGYLELRGLMTTVQERAMMQIVQQLGEQSIAEVRQAAEQGQYRRAIAELYFWHAFLHTGRYSTVLPAHLYAEQNTLLQALFDEQQQALIRQMEAAAEVNISDVMQQRRRFQLDRSQRIQLEEMEAELRFVEEYERGKAALRKKRFTQAMRAFDLANQKSAALSSRGRYTSATTEKRNLIENGRRLALEGIWLERMERDATLGASAQKDAYRDLWRIRRSYAAVPLTERAERAIQDMELDWFGGACRKEYRQYTLQLLDAEAAIEQADYLTVVQALHSAEALQYQIEPCMLPMEDLSTQIRYYELALEFNQRKEELKTLHGNGDWDVLETAYEDLWTDYIRFEIKKKFGYEMQPFDAYVIRSSESALLSYYVLSHCTFLEDHGAVVEMVQRLTHLQSKEAMQVLGAEVAYRMYAYMPDSNYKSSFEYIQPKGGFDKRTFRKFKIGYRKAWKKMR